MFTVESLGDCFHCTWKQHTPEVPSHGAWTVLQRWLWRGLTSSSLLETSNFWHEQRAEGGGERGDCSPLSAETTGVLLLDPRASISPSFLLCQPLPGVLCQGTCALEGLPLSWFWLFRTTWVGFGVPHLTLLVWLHFLKGQGPSTLVSFLFLSRNIKAFLLNIL